ncbi:MAG: hypothetical protein LBL71_03635, partial [Endomicrobium sp.]|nr:hypothetical protein [Endomicrobium sp.]
LPDIILYIEDRNWLFFIEAVTSVGPIDSNRLLEINAVTKVINAGKIFITAFANINTNTYKKFASEIALETEVWLADQPHMIHLNGNKFLNPR